jgi:hypothetical protein|tara:strand:- start:299 stop:733 length:435 start_codon:yes stop_codon:yes gene_type:complete
MTDATIVITFFLAYKLIKKNISNDPTKGSWSHLEIAILLGHIAFILGQYFLLASDGSLILTKSEILVQVLAALIASDIQDIFVTKRPSYFYSAVLLEYILWSSLGLTAVLSGKFIIGATLFVACISRIAEIINHYSWSQNQKNE